MKNNILLITLLSFSINLFSFPTAEINNSTYTMCQEANLIITENEGTIFDSGGQFDNYSNNENCSILIDLECSENIEFDITSFNLETCCDDLRIYDGPTTQNNLIYSNDGTGIFQTGGTALITFSSDGSFSLSGFEIFFENTNTNSDEPITSNFFVTNNPILAHPTQFTDLSSPEPSFWDWDFGDGVKSTEQNPMHIYQNPGEYTVQLISTNCEFSDTLSKTVIVQESPTISISPESFNLNMNCGTDTTIYVTITNSSIENAGFIEVIETNSQIENISLFEILEFSGQDHLFTFTPTIVENIDSFSIEITVNGDYSSSIEYADIYIEGEFVNTIGEGFQQDGVDITKIFTFPIEVLNQWLNDGEIEVEVDNSTSVNILGTAENSTTVNLFLMQNVISSIGETSLIVDENSSTDLEIHISTSNIENGIYDESFFITTNDQNNTAFMVSLIINVDGEGLISFADDCLDFGIVQQFNSETLPLPIENIGCTNLNIQNISFSTNELSTNQVFFTMDAFDKDTIDIQYSPSNQYTGIDTIYILTNNGTFKHCINLESVFAPLAVIEPVQITLACNQDSLIDIPFINQGLGNLDFFINSMEEYEDSDVIIFNFNNLEYDFSFTNYPLFNDVIITIGIDDLIVDNDEYVDVYIENIFIERLMNISTALNEFEYSFNGQEAISMLQDGEINVRLITADGISGFSTANFEVTVRSTELISEEFSSFESTVAANDTFINQLSISSSPFIAGDYTFDYTITTNDPFNPVINLPIYLTVADVPISQLNTDCFALDTIFQFQTIEETLIIANPTCASLNVINVIGSSEAINFNKTLFNIPAYSSDSIIVTFSENNVTPFDENIIITSNAGLDTICINGVTELPPILNVNPTSIEVDIPACYDSVTVQLTIQNTGNNSLDFELVETEESVIISDIETLKAVISDNIEDFSAEIANKFSFTNGFTGTSILDGGSDMYDSGNILNTTNFNSLSYSNNMISNLEDGTNAISYFTFKQNDLFVFAGNLTNEDEFFISGFLGADGSGSFEGGELSGIENNSYSAFYKKVYDSFDPSVNHLIIVNTDSNDELTQSLPTTTDSDFNEISNLGPNTTIIYVLFAGNSSFEYEEEVFEDLANQIISLFPENTNSSSNENKGTIEPSETSTIDVTFYSGNLNEGTYNDTIFIQSNDPLNSLYEVPVLINIDETLCDLEIIPNIDACSGFVNFVPTFFNEATTYNWDFGDGNTSTLSAPVHFYENTGLFDVTLTISNEISSLSESIQLSINQNNGPKSACEVLGNTNFPNNEIMHFQLGDIDNETANTTGVFHDFSCTQSTTLVQGETYPYLIEIEFGFNDNAMILIDYNNNGTFEEVEVIVNGNSGNSEFITGNYVVPDNIPLDIPLRLRVISDPNNSFSPCETSFGEGEDYTVIFISNEQPPIVDFETSAIDPCEGILQFIDQSIFSPHTYLWDFGDGNTSTIMDPIHTYDSSGIFTVSLTATNDFGTQTVTKQVLSNALKPQINIISQDLEANTPILMEAIGNNVTTWFWQFGNGETSNNQIASTEYDADGPYVVNLTAVNQIGCQRTISQIIYIGTVSNSEIDHSITVYPNPSTQGFYIENLSNKSIKSLRLMNAAGKICKEQHITSNNSNQEFYVEKGNIPSGFYHLIMEFEDGNTINKKIIFIE